MIRPIQQNDDAPPLLRGICLVVKGDDRKFDRIEPRRVAAAAVSAFPPRPSPRVLSESIPLFFIGRNQNGLWVAREAEGRTGGLFWFKRSAMRFAKKHSTPFGCATMLLSRRLELDIENRGNPLIARLDAAMRRTIRRTPNTTVSHTTIERTRGKGEQL